MVSKLQYLYQGGLIFLGVGKTTLVKKCCDLLKESGISIQGFYTEEIREQRKRVGFDVITLDGQHAALARVK